MSHLLILQNGLVYNGLAEKPVQADVAIKDGVIAQIAPKISGETGQCLDVSGLAVAPGFIDIHSHSDTTFLRDDRCESKIMQGVTSELAGQCGSTVYPCADDRLENLYAYVGEKSPFASTSLASFVSKCRRENRRMSTNLISLIGHGALRCGVMGLEGRAATEKEIDLMAELLQQEMANGAWGLSLGLGYAPGIFANQQELNALGKVVYRYDGIITSHMRNQGAEIFPALEEMFEIYRATGAHVHIAHLKMSGKKQWGTADKLMEYLRQARANGIWVTQDMYPYTASSSGLTNIFPKWTLAGGVEMAAQRLTTKDRGPIMEALEEYFQTRQDGEGVYIVSTGGRFPEADDSTIWELSQRYGLSMAQTVEKVVLATQGHCSCIFESMSREDVEYLLRQPEVAIGSDGSGIVVDPKAHVGKPHPRNFGTFPRVLKMAREGAFPMEQAVHRMTGLCADYIGLKHRGFLREGYTADITVFDPQTVGDTANYSNPFQYPSGIIHVLMGGEFAVRDGVQTEKRLGRFLRKGE